MFSTTVTQPSRLGPVPEDATTQTHHVKDNSGKTTKFMNPHESYVPPNLWDIFGMMWSNTFGRSPFPKPESDVVDVVRPQLLSSRTGVEGSQELRATWLGHACYYVEYPSGLRVLFDPVFEDHCAPIKSASFKRYTQPACEISELPFVDAVCISHSHYDHLSVDSVKTIHKNFPRAHFFVGLGLKDWFVKTGLGNNVTECDWWEDVEVTLTPEKGTEEKATEPITARISCLPCQHSSGRNGFDRDKTLWCSWAVASGSAATPESQKSVLFLGDTGYRAVPKLPADVDDYEHPYDKLPTNPQFAQVGNLRGPFDLGLIPIGAYAPRGLFSGMHGNPYDAVEMFRDTQCKRAMAIHWGTWILTTEDLREPPKLLKEALRRRGIAEEGVFDICKVGETRSF
ncbi:nape-hydrolyzing phospholipase d [Seiridium cupressi]